MKTPLLAVVAMVALSASAALAQPESMTNLIGNTLISKSPQGAESRIQYKADGTFKGSVPAMGFTFQGDWEVEGDQVCRTYKPAIPNRANPDCSPTLPWLRVGQSFEAPNGLTVSLIEGAN